MPGREIPPRSSADGHDAIEWIDPAGYLFAKSFGLKWRSAYVDRFDFRLVPAKKVVKAKTFI